MPVKVKRGLGLLVIAAIGFLLGLVLLNTNAAGAAEIPVFVGLLVALAAFFGGIIGGLGLLAWGLLRD